MLTDNFDSYTDGDLTGQGSWSGSVNFDIQGTTVWQGAKAVTHATAASNSISKGFTIEATGIQSVFGMATSVSNDGDWAFRLYEGASPKVYVKVNAGNLQYFNGVSYVTIGAVSANLWFRLDIEWKTSDDTARYRLNNGTWTSFAAFSGTVTTGMDNVYLVKDSANATAVYWDSISGVIGTIERYSSAYSGFNGAAVSTVNYTVDVGSGTDRFLIVAPLCVPHSGTADILTSITYNGVALTKQISEEPQTSGQWIGIWTLKNPTAGSNTLTLNASANWGTGGGLYTHWACYTGVTGTPIINVGAAVDNLTNNVTLSVTTTGDNAWLYSSTRSIDTGDQIAGSGTIENTDTANSTGDSNGAKTPTGSYSMKWTTSGAKLCGVVIAFAPAAIVTTNSGFFNLM